MFRKIWHTFFSLWNRHRIPKLPRMLATRYDTIPGDVRYVMRRLGCRDPRGVTIAMRHYGVTSVQELIDVLEHQKPRRQIGRRVWLAVARMVGESDTPAHVDEIRRSTRNTKQRRARLDVQQRIARALEKRP